VDRYGTSVSSSRLGGQAYYDDVADLTWLADANPTGATMNWAATNAWVAGLNISGVTGWRLPSSLNSDGSGPCGPASSCTDSEMGNLYYNVLGNAAGGPLTNTSPFSNVQSNHYWSSTEVAPNPSSAWFFGFNSGSQSHISKGVGKFGWAVQSGNVGAVPVPGAVWLFGSGLIGLLGLARRKR
jgi:hypothetical protein